MTPPLSDPPDLAQECPCHFLTYRFGILFALIREACALPVLLKPGWHGNIPAEYMENVLEFVHGIETISIPVTALYHNTG